LGWVESTRMQCPGCNPHSFHEALIVIEHLEFFYCQ
jgi:hypothetical protein